MNDRALLLEEPLECLEIPALENSARVEFVEHRPWRRAPTGLFPFCVKPPSHGRFQSGPGGNESLLVEARLEHPFDISQGSADVLFRGLLGFSLVRHRLAFRSQDEDVEPP